ncbi:ABC transporter ATP-binding protein [Methyloparacoccus murrellii]
MKALSLRGLRKTYRNGMEALKGIDLDVATGDFFALLGPNGAGKSTTIGIISSLVNKTAGRVEIFGLDLDRQRDAAKRLIGLVPQEVNFNQFETVLSVVANHAGYQGIPRREARERAENCLDQLGLWGKRHSVSRTLSGGMKRRLMIARALVHSPRLLILDEPTAGVDIEIRRSMWELLTRINREGTTIILTTHYLEEAENLCRHIAIINHGRIVEHAAMDSLLARLHASRYILELDRPLAVLPELAAMRLERIDERTLSAEVPTEVGVHALFDALAAIGVRVMALRNAANRLEQLFFDLLDNARERPGDPV